MKLTLLSFGLLGIASAAIAQMQQQAPIQQIDTISTASIANHASAWSLEKSGQATGCSLNLNSSQNRSVSLSGCENFLPQPNEWKISAPNNRGEITLSNAATQTTLMFVEAEHGGYDMIKPAYPLLTLIRN